MGLLHAGGGATFTEDNRSCIVNNPENVATLQRIQDEMAAGNAVHRGMTPAGLDSFVTGSIAMEMQGSWAAFYMLDGIGDSFEWDIVKLPQRLHRLDQRFGRWRRLGHRHQHRRPRCGMGILQVHHQH